MGFIGMFIILYGFSQSNDKKARVIIACSMIAWILHFYFMWLFTAVIGACIWLMRMLLSMKFKKNVYAFGSIVAISTIFGIVSFTSLLYLIPIITSIIWSVAYFFLEKVMFRIFNLFNSFLWLVFAVNVWSLWQMMNEVMTQFILIMVIFRMLWDQGYLHHYRDKINHILHKNHQVDMWELVILKDRDKIIKTHGYIWKLTHMFSKK